MDFLRAATVISNIKECIISQMRDGPLGIPEEFIERLISTLEDAAEQKRQEVLKTLDVADLRNSYNAHVINPKIAAAQVTLMNSLSKPNSTDPSDPANIRGESPKDWQQV